MNFDTDVAMESAGVTLVNGDLMGIVRAIALSRKTMRNIRQNLVSAFGYNAVDEPGPWRHAAGDAPSSRLKARLNAASES